MIDEMEQIINNLLFSYFDPKVTPQYQEKLVEATETNYNVLKEYAINNIKFNVKLNLNSNTPQIWEATASFPFSLVLHFLFNTKKAIISNECSQIIKPYEMAGKVIRSIQKMKVNDDDDDIL